MKKMIVLPPVLFLTLGGFVVGFPMSDIVQAAKEKDCTVRPIENFLIKNGLEGDVIFPERIAGLKGSFVRQQVDFSPTSTFNDEREFHSGK